LTRVTNADQVLALLRNHLDRAQRRRGAGQASTPPGPREDATARIQGVVQAAPLPQNEIERAVIAGLLVDAFGDAIANDARFQAIVTEVQRIVSADKDGRALLTRAIAKLTGAV